MRRFWETRAILAILLGAALLVGFWGAKEAREGQAASPWRVTDYYIEYEAGLLCYRIDIISVDLPDYLLCLYRSTPPEDIAGIIKSHTERYIEIGSVEAGRWKLPTGVPR